MFKQYRFSSYRLKEYLTKIPNKKNQPIGPNGSRILYGINQPYSIMHNQYELNPMAELIDYIYTVFSHSNINIGSNFHLLQRKYRILPLDSMITVNNDLNVLYNFERNRENFKSANYSVLYYYNMETDVILETASGLYKPKEFDLLFINNDYKHIVKRNIGSFDTLRFKFY